MLFLVGMILLTVSVITITRGFAWWRGNEWRRVSARSEREHRSPRR